jgi:hypothetical protein
LDGDILIRRLSEQQLVTDKDGVRVPSSLAFQASTANGGMSVDIEKLIVESGQDPRVFVTTPRWTGSVFFHARPLRDLQLMVGYNPVDENPFHGEVWGISSRSTQRKLKNIYVWYVKIP